MQGLTDEGDEAVPYTFGLEYNTPMKVVILPDGSAYRVEKTDLGLTIHRVTQDEEGLWTGDGEEIIRNARRTRFLSELDDLPGDFPCTAMRALTIGQLSRLADVDLRIMRNEIYARRGLRFAGGGEMQRHFESKDWYHPEADDVSDRLTELDALNISMIRRAEEMMTNETCQH